MLEARQIFITRVNNECKYIGCYLPVARYFGDNLAFQINKKVFCIVLNNMFSWMFYTVKLHNQVKSMLCSFSAVVGFIFARHFIVWETTAAESGSDKIVI